MSSKKAVLGWILWRTTDILLVTLDFKFGVIMISLLLSLAMVGDTQTMDSKEQSADDNKRVCRSVETLGSKIPKRVCRTQGEWAQLDRANSSMSTESIRRDHSYSRGTQNSN